MLGVSTYIGFFFINSTSLFFSKDLTVKSVNMPCALILEVVGVARKGIEFQLRKTHRGIGRLDQF